MLIGPSKRLSHEMAGRVSCACGIGRQLKSGVLPCWQATAMRCELAMRLTLHPQRIARQERLPVMTRREKVWFVAAASSAEDNGLVLAQARRSIRLEFHRTRSDGRGLSSCCGPINVDNHGVHLAASKEHGTSRPGLVRCDAATSSAAAICVQQRAAGRTASR